MIVEMLAADERILTIWTPSAPPATSPELQALSREQWMQDVVDHTGQAFLG